VNENFILFENKENEKVKANCYKSLQQSIIKDTTLTINVISSCARREILFDAKSSERNKLKLIVAI